MGTRNRSGPNVGQASRLPSERASASGSVPSALPTGAGETPALHCGSWKESAIGRRLAAGILGVTIAFSAVAAGPSEEPGFKSLFNGKDLNGWAGRPQHWTVEDGAITGRTTKDHPAEGNNFLIWTNGTVSDFELRLSYKIVPNNNTGFANSGIQYRSKDFGNFVVGGYQADFEAGKTYSGILYEERMDGILAQRGQKTVVKTMDGKTKVETVGSLGKSEEIQAKIKDQDWNDYRVVAQGNHLQHFINGVQTVDVIDERTGGKAAKEGILALQLHQGEPMTVQFREIRLKSSPGEKSTKSDLERLQGDWAPVEMVANGEKVSAESLANIKLKVKGNEYFLETNDGQDQGTFKIIEGSDPRSMDVTTAAGAQLAAIYEVSADTFKACYSVNGASRPTEFKSAEGSDHVLTIYKRKTQ